MNYYNGNQRGKTIIINGRRMPVDGGISGMELQQAVGAGQGRRPVMYDGMNAQTIDPGRYYGPNDLIGRNGKPIKITSIPDRTKGGIFDGRRNEASKQLIRRQVFDMAANFARSGLDFDEDDSNWVIFPHFRMPKGWGVDQAPLMVLFPTDYPLVPPIGFYLPSQLNSPQGHFFSQAYHDASETPTQEGWNWYCCYISGVWRATRDDGRDGWKRGDNLWTYLTLVNEVLSSGPAS
jgi:hypothetical protein